MPITPRSEKGARDFKFLSQQSGNNTKPVTDHKTVVRSSIGDKAVKESAKTMEKARHAKKVFVVVLQAGTLDVAGPIVLAQASV